LAVRERTPQDDDFILQLTEEQWRTAPMQQGSPFPREVFARYLQSGMPTRVIERDGKRIGYYSYVVGPDGRLHVSALVVEPTQQTDPVLGTVLEHLEQDARSHGARVMEVLVPADHERGLGLTERLGFREVWRLPQGLVVFQRVVAEHSSAAGSMRPGVTDGSGYQGPVPLP
jgi:ribosomal protein S18 acetylase RimI-like enzyme